jgi:hypothetical protein
MGRTIWSWCVSLAGFLEHVALDAAKGTLRDDIALVGARPLDRASQRR